MERSSDGTRVTSWKYVGLSTKKNAIQSRRIMNDEKRHAR